MSAQLGKHCYELVFDAEGMNRTIIFDAFDRSGIFSDHYRIAGTFEIIENGIRIGQASYSRTGNFWVLSA